MKSSLFRFVLVGLAVSTLAVLSTGVADAQCSTCPTATVAYQPVVAQTTVAYRPYSGWYPGKLLDGLRLRRYGVAAPVAAPTYSASYSPYSVGYAPSVGYTPYTAAYRPYVTSYAPLVRRTVARPIVQTSYYAPTVAYNSCSSCVQTVARQVVLHPIVNSCYSPCHTGCSGCSACSTGVSQASYTEPACSNCASSPATPSYVAPAPPSSRGATAGPNTGQPALGQNEQIPGQSNYPPPISPTPAVVPEDGEADIDPFDLDEKTPGDAAAPADSNTLFEAPRLLDPRDRTANRPTVDVWNAVYSQPVSRKTVAQTSYKTTTTPSKIGADGWSSVPRNR